MNGSLNKQVQLTSTGHDALVKELAQLKDIKRPALVERLSHARQEGDLSENADYQSARDELEFLDGRIEELQEVLKNALVVKGTKKSGVDIGTKVTVRINGDRSTFHIVGEWEADPAQKKISHSSPLGTALMGKKVGEKVEVTAPVGKVTYTIVSIE